MKTTITLFGIATAFLLSSCGGQEIAAAAKPASAQASAASTRHAASARAASDTDPCQLVSTRDMSSMFGELKEGPLPSSGLRNERQCNYTNMSGSWIKLSLYGGQDRWGWEKGISSAQNPRDVGGLGDEAFAIRRGTDAVVYVRKGEAILELSCSCSAETAEAIARVTTTRL